MPTVIYTTPTIKHTKTRARLEIHRSLFVLKISLFGPTDTLIEEPHDDRVLREQIYEFATTP